MIAVMMKLPIAFGLVAVTAVVATAQQGTTLPDTLTLSTVMIRSHAGLQRNLQEAADLMPEPDYGFRATPEVKPFSQSVAHIALSQFAACAALKEDTNPKAAEKEETPRSKAELVSLLKDSASYCEPAITAMTDDGMVQLMTFGKSRAARGLVIVNNNVHGNEMYGTMSVYLRLKGLVPPTTARQQKK